MRIRTALIPAAIAALSAACASAPGAGATADHGETYLLDLLRLKPGVEPPQASEYFSRIAPVLEKHGLRPVARYHVEKRLAGTVEPQMVNVWSMPGPETMTAIMSDPNYRANVSFRDSTFDMSRAEMFLMEAVMPIDKGEAPLAFVDLLDVNPGVELNQADVYFSRIEPVVEKHGFVPMARFRVTKRLAGHLDPKLVNLWSMASANAMAGIREDPRYQANVPLRNATFAMKRAEMFTLTPVRDSTAGPR